MPVFSGHAALGPFIWSGGTSALVRVVGPVLEPVTVAELKTYVRVDHATEDALLAELIATARALVEETTGRALLAQQWRLRVPLAHRVALPRGPVLAIGAVQVLAADLSATAVPAEQYTLDTDREELRLHTLHAGGAAAPERLEVTYTAGYGESAAAVPAPLRQAVLQYAAHLYDTRAATDFPAAARALLEPYRWIRL